MNAANVSTYYDFQGLAALRTQAINTPTEAVGEVASQFESLFVQMMLKSMREATIDGGLFDSNQMDLYKGMLDQQVSMQLSSQGALGLSDILVEQLDGRRDAVEKSDSGSDMNPLTDLLALARRPQSAIAATEYTAPTAAIPGDTVASAATSTAESADDWNPSSPEEFIRGVWEHAVSAAREIGLDPLVLVAQSALETGWGKKVIQTADGASSFNLFGVKTGGTWSGKEATVNTLEFRDGVAALEKASFRVYESLAGSFQDYVDFLKGNPRYQQALEKVADGRDFLQGLQDAGYATDPGYAEKILNIIGTAAYGSIVNELKEL